MLENVIEGGIETVPSLKKQAQSESPFSQCSASTYDMRSSQYSGVENSNQTPVSRYAFDKNANSPASIDLSPLST